MRVGRKGPFLPSVLQFFVSQPNQHCESITRQIDNQTFVPFMVNVLTLGPTKEAAAACQEEHHGIIINSTFISIVSLQKPAAWPSGQDSNGGKLKLEGTLSRTRLIFFL